MVSGSMSGPSAWFTVFGLVLSAAACSHEINHQLTPRTLVEAERLLENFPHGEYPKNMAPSARWNDWAQATVLHWLATGHRLDRTEPARYAGGTEPELPEAVSSSSTAEPLIQDNPWQLRYDGQRPYSVTHWVPYHMDSFLWDKDTPAQHARDYFDWLAASGASGVEIGNLLSAVLLARRCGVEVSAATRDAILAELEVRTWRRGGRVGITGSFSGKPTPEDTVQGALLLAVFGRLTPALHAEFTPEMSHVFESDGRIIADRPLFQIMGMALLRQQNW